jgi:hypothetical protein
MKLLSVNVSLPKVTLRTGTRDRHLRPNGEGLAGVSQPTLRLNRITVGSTGKMGEMSAAKCRRRDFGAT